MVWPALTLSPTLTLTPSTEPGIGLVTDVPPGAAFAAGAGVAAAGAGVAAAFGAGAGAAAAGVGAAAFGAGAATGCTGVETPEAISSRVSMWNADMRSTSTSYFLPFMVTTYFIFVASCFVLGLLQLFDARDIDLFR